MKIFLAFTLAFFALAQPVKEARMMLEENWIIQKLYQNAYGYTMGLNPNYNYVQPAANMPSVTFDDQTAVKIKFYFNEATNLRLEMRLEEFEYDCDNNFMLYFDGTQTQYQNYPCTGEAIAAGYKICGSAPLNFVSSTNSSFLHYCNGDAVNGVAVPPKILLGATDDPACTPPVVAPTTPATDQNECGVPSVMTPYVSGGVIASSDTHAAEDIVGGSYAQPRQYPWQAAFYNYNSFCGGSLLDKRHVLTAAHCLNSNKDVSEMTIYLGAYNRSDFFESDRITCAVTNVVVHEGYEMEADDTVDDLAMLTIDCGINIAYNQAIRPICLPSHDVAQSTGTNMIMSGWGKTSGAPDGTASQVLKAATTAIYDQQSCAAYYSGSAQPGWLCAFSAGSVNSVCNGDSGGPIVGYDGSAFTLYGVASFVAMNTSTGYACLPNKPYVFADVFYYLDWINDHL